MSLVITLLLNLLVSFLTALIKKWIDSQAWFAPTLEHFNAAKPEFMKMVKRRFWLGPKRLERASKAFDLSILNYNCIHPTIAGQDVKTAREVAEAMVQGVAEKL